MVKRGEFHRQGEDPRGLYTGSLFHMPTLDNVCSPVSDPEDVSGNAI